MKHHLTEKYGHNFEIHNIVIPSQSFSLIRLLIYLHFVLPMATVDCALLIVGWSPVEHH